jgi:hypothetical protein
MLGGAPEADDHHLNHLFLSHAFNFSQAATASRKEFNLNRVRPLMFGTEHFPHWYQSSCIANVGMCGDTVHRSY